MKNKKIVVVLPAYNAEKTLLKTYRDIPEKLRRHVLLVDDGSNDKTVMKAKSLGIQTIVHPQNRGYGGNQKTCYTLALSQGAGIIVMIHPDYQYDATLTEELVRPLLQGREDIMLGSRIRTRAEVLAGGMPVWKYIGNRFLTVIENTVLGRNLSEYHTGMRAYTKDALAAVPFHKFSDDFVFDQEMLVSAVHSGLRIGEIPVPVRYFPEASSIQFRRSAIYGVSTLLTLFKYIIHQTHLFSFSIFQEK